MPPAEGDVYQSSRDFIGASPRWRLSSSFQIIAVWEKNFRLPDPVTAEKMASLQKNFVNMARQQVKFGPSSVSDFTKWRVKSFTFSAPRVRCSAASSSPDSLVSLSFWSQVEALAREYLQSLTEPTEEAEDTETTEVPVRRF